MIHGKKKQKIVKTQKQLKEQQQLSDKINAKLSDFFQIRNKQYTDNDIPKYMEFTSLLMQLCSDIPTIFNFRRQLLQRAIEMNIGDLKKQGLLLVSEIKLVTKLIREDPKSYTLWSFRQWLVQNIYKLNPQIVNEQKQLCKLLLTKDEKNFHVWNYRNWINSVQFDIDEQLQFTEEKIKFNPFNFSPYHFRSKYLPLKYIPLLKDESTTEQTKQQIAKYGMPKTVFDAELQSIKTALYLNPNEEAPWIYYRWLLKRILPTIVLSYKNQNHKHTFVLSQRVQDFSQSLKFETEFKTLTNEDLSTDWQFYSEGSVEFPSGKEPTIVNTEGIQKHLIFTVNEQLNEFKQIYKVQAQYIRQILQEETNCRFAWLQLLELLKNQLLLTCTEQQWKTITSEGIQVFEALHSQTKTKHYIDKLKEYWLRIGVVGNLNFYQKLFIR